MYVHVILCYSKEHSKCASCNMSSHEYNLLTYTVFILRNQTATLQVQQLTIIAHHACYTSCDYCQNTVTKQVANTHFFHHVDHFHSPCFSLPLLALW